MTRKESWTLAETLLASLVAQGFFSTLNTTLKTLGKIVTCILSAHARYHRYLLMGFGTKGTKGTLYSSVRKIHFDDGANETVHVW